MYDKIFDELKLMKAETEKDFLYFQEFGGSADDPYYINRFTIIRDIEEIVWRYQQLET